MRKEIICIECNHITDIEKYCEVCGYKLNKFSVSQIGQKIFALKGNPIELIIENESYDFCSMECAISFLTDELKKEK